MRQMLIRVCSVIILICSICGCAQIAGNTSVAKKVCTGMLNAGVAENEETVNTETEDRKVAETEEANAIKAEQTDPTTDDESEEEMVVKIDSISQLLVSGRTPEETNLIKEILSKHEEECETFLMGNWEYPHIQWWVEVDGYDFTGDGEEEIIISKCDVLESQMVSYNYVYGREGNMLLEFVGQNPLEARIINGWNGDGTFLIYNSSAHVAHIYPDIYTEIRWENGVLEEQVKLIEFDTRDSVRMLEGKEGYYIIKNLTKKEEEKLLEGVGGIFDLTETKEYTWEDKDLDEYKQLFDTEETEEFTHIGCILYWESAGFVWKW